MTDDLETLSEKEALRLWQRAAQLQAEAARRAEARAAGGEEGASGTAVARCEEDGYALAHVRAAAVEAGISEEYVDTALAELRADRVAAATAGTPDRPISHWILGGPDEAVVTRREIHATPEAVLSAMEEILPFEPFCLTLRERLGDPTRGGVLVFDIQGTGLGGLSRPGFVGEASMADLRQVMASLTVRAGEPPRTTLTVSAPVAWAWRLNAGMSALFGAVGGGLGLSVGAGVALGLLAGVLGPLGVGLVFAVAGGAGAWGGLSGFRALYRYGSGRGRKALEGLLAAVAARAQGGWGLVPPS